MSLLDERVKWKEDAAVAAVVIVFLTIGFIAGCAFMMQTANYRFINAKAHEAMSATALRDAEFAQFIRDSKVPPKEAKRVK